MKTLSALALSLSLLAGAAFANDTPATATHDAAKTATMKSCDKEATAKNLHGDARTKFVKDCQAGKHTS